MKKLLSSLMGLSLITTSTASVVACGSSKDPEGTLKIGYSETVGNWNPVKSMNVSDGRITSNTNATPLATDEYGREYGDLFEPQAGYSAEDPYIGKHNEDFTEWTYKLREDTTWSDYKGNKVSDLTVNDFINTAKFVLNANNTSEVAEIWTGFIEGAAELYEASGKDGADFNQLWEQHKDNLGIEVNEQERTVKFTLEKSASYFETLLTYSVFSPIHEDMLKDPRTNLDYKKSRYSGAYVVTSYSNSGNIILDKNENYHLIEDTYIPRVKYVWAVGASKTRELFNANTLNEFDVVANDSAGWNSFVGDPAEPKETAGMAEYAESADDATTYLMFYNLLNSNAFDGSASNDAKQAAKLSSMLLQSNDVREFISTNLDRTKFVQYYSKPFDTGKDKSSMLRNTYVPEFIKNGNTSYVDEMEVAVKETLNSPEDVNLDDGEGFVESLKDTSAQLEKVNAYIDSVPALKSAASGGKISLNVVLNPNGNSTTNIFLRMMMDEFNAIAGNPIKFEYSEVVDFNTYVSMIQSGKSDIVISGWSPDYADAYSYLSTLALGGAYDQYNGQSRLFQLNTGENVENLEWSTVEERLTSIGLGDVIVSDVTQELFEARKSYTTGVLNIDKTGTGEQRNKDFAKLEAATLYDQFLVMPLYKKSAPKTFTVSYVDPYQRSFMPYGLSSYKYWGQTISSELMSSTAIKAAAAEYLKIREEVLEDKTTHRDGSAWK